MNVFSPFLIFPLRKYEGFRDYVYYKLVDRSINFFDVSIGSEELRITGLQPYKLDSSTEGGLIYPVILNRDFLTTQSINHGRPQVTGANTYSLSVLTFLRTHSASTLNTVVSATFVNRFGTLQYVRSNEPRFEYAQLGSGAAGSTIYFNNVTGLLIEPTRINIARHSTNFTTTSAPTNTIRFISSPAITAPDGRSFSTAVSTNNPGTSFLYLTGCNSGLINRRYTISFFIKPVGGASQTGFTINQHPLHQGSTMRFTLQPVDGRIIINSRSNSSDKVAAEYYSSYGWHRVWFTTVANANNARLWPGFSTMPTVLINGIAVPGGREFFVWGLQIEEGDTPTSYIPVDGFNGMRGADTLSLSGANLWAIYSSTPISNVTPNSATIYIESRKKYFSESLQTLLRFTDKNLANSNAIMYSSTSSSTISSNALANFSLDTRATWVNTNVKTAFSYNNISKTITLASNGQAAVTTTTGSFQLSGIQFGSDYSGHIRKLFIFPDSISLGDLLILTT